MKRSVAFILSTTLIVVVLSTAFSTVSAFYNGFIFGLAESNPNSKIGLELAYDLFGVMDGVLSSFIVLSLLLWIRSDSKLYIKRVSYGFFGKFCLDGLVLVSPAEIWIAAEQRSQLSPLIRSLVKFFEPMPYGIQSGILALLLLYLVRAETK